MYILAAVNKLPLFFFDLHVQVFCCHSFFTVQSVSFSCFPNAVCFAFCFIR